MKILIYGAGVIGSVFAGLLAKAGHDVSVLARGRRLFELKLRRLQVEDARTGQCSRCVVGVVESLQRNDHYDLIVVAVQKPQVNEVLPVLAHNTGCDQILFMVNTAEGCARWAMAVGQERLLVGLPGFGGVKDGWVTRYAMVPPALQPTVIGEADGELSDRVKHLAWVLRAAGIPTRVCRNMEAWQKTHVAWVVPLASALRKAGGDPDRLAHSAGALALTIQAVREELGVLDALGIPITPRRIQLVRRLPMRLVRVALRKLLSSELARVAIAPHARIAEEEMNELTRELRALTARAEVPTPAADALCPAA